MSVAKLKKVIWTIFKYATLLLAIFIAVLPLVSCVITAFKTPEEYASTNVMQLPQSWTYFENFIQAWKQANMQQHLETHLLSWYLSFLVQL